MVSQRTISASATGVCPLLPTVAARQHELGQFLTPASVADLMASLFLDLPAEIELLDAGAGHGALSEAFVRRLCAGSRKPRRISVAAYEIDGSVIEELRASMNRCARECEQVGIAFAANVINEDFIAAAVPMVGGDMFSSPPPRFNAAIVNPPYRKIHSGSQTRHLLRSAGIETSNLYAGFVALIVKLLAESGQLVAITPRSFCNGPYFKPFRSAFLKAMSLRRIHVFESRSAAFRDDDVLQENVIVHAVKEQRRPQHVTVSISSGWSGDPIREREVNYEEVVLPDDPGLFIHLLVEDGHVEAKSVMDRFPATLADLGLTVSTGRVVDFRADACLRQQPGEDTVPLIYPCHFDGGFIKWPKEGSRKPNAIVDDARTRGLLVPSGAYVLVKRFSPKEEHHRVVACVYDPDRVRSPMVGFENHLNYFHFQGQGMSMELARGLAAFLNSAIVDVYFRRFSGHTQVNATDLRSLRYPDRDMLERIGQALNAPDAPQEDWDSMVRRFL
jgi:adenine-specific DNA-methyltransferase